MKRSILLSLMVIGAVAALITAATSAVFSDEVTSTGNTFTSGTLIINIDGQHPTESGQLTFSDMTPGDYKVQKVHVSNPGTLQLRYAVTGATSPSDLNGALVMAVATAGTCTVGGTGTGAIGGTFLYGTADPNQSTGSGGLPITGSSGKIIGDPAQHAQTGDRPLDPTTGEDLCFKVLLPGLTGNAYQGKTSTLTLTFSAEQTANN
jgi:predicted ribosomally synthesized peptide with SipW-like signal peptide